MWPFIKKEKIQLTRPQELNKHILEMRLFLENNPLHPHYLDILKILLDAKEELHNYSLENKETELYQEAVLVEAHNRLKEESRLDAQKQFEKDVLAKMEELRANQNEEKI